MPMRVACRYSSSRCAPKADGASMVMTIASSEACFIVQRTANSEPRTANREQRTANSELVLYQPRPVIVRRIPIDGVDVIQVPLLRRVLDDQRRTLNPVIGQLTVRRRTTPREVRCREV